MPNCAYVKCQEPLRSEKILGTGYHAFCWIKHNRMQWEAAGPATRKRIEKHMALMAKHSTNND